MIELQLTYPLNHLTCPLPLCHHVTASVIWLAPCHHTSQSFDLPTTITSVSHLTCPLPPHYCVTAVVSHLPCPYHHTSQSLDLPTTTTSVGHLTYPLPLYHCITISLHYHVIALVSHLPCPLPPHQSVIWLALYHCFTALPHHCTVTSSPMWDFPHHIGMNHLTCPYHYITASLHEIFPTTLVWIIWLAPTTAWLCHHITALPHEIFPTTLVWIWLVNATQHSCDRLIVPTTANQIISI